MVHAYITHKGHKIYLLRFFLRRRLAACRDSIETESKKAKKNTKNLFLVMNKNVFPLFEEKQHKRWKQTLLVHEYNYAMDSKGRNERQGRDKKIAELLEAQNEQKFVDDKQR